VSSKSFVLPSRTSDLLPRRKICSWDVPMFERAA
jgi:hypothetical protein